MARLENSLGRKGGGYERLFGNEELGHLISRVQGAVISSGTELERIIIREVNPIENLDAFLEQEIMPEGVFLAVKQQLKKSRTFDFSGSEPDFVVFRRRDNKQMCHIVELKDGDNFDTKKATAEHRSVHEFISQNAQHINYRMAAHICCFNQLCKEEIVQGFKNRISIDEALTGPEFCELLEINYKKIVEERKADQQPNIEFFVRELSTIESVRDLFLQYLETPAEEQRSMFD